MNSVSRYFVEMGVTNLWQVLSPVQQNKPMSALAGKTIAVDLSIWVCENQCVKQMQGVVTRPYLRFVCKDMSKTIKFPVSI